MRRIFDGCYLWASPNSRYLDYKQETYGDAGADRSEFLADVSSFANTLGGDLVIGVAEKKGLPTALTPFMGDGDSEKRRLEQIALSGLEPRIPNFQIRSVPISTGGHVIIIRAPRSFIPPHRVIARDSNRFWARAGTTKYQPNVEQLRRLFSDGLGLPSACGFFRPIGSLRLRLETRRYQ